MREDLAFVLQVFWGHSRDQASEVSWKTCDNSAPYVESLRVPKP